MAKAATIQAMINRYFPPDTHPYQVLQRKIQEHLESSHAVLEIGCGRTASNLLELKGRARLLIGIDLVKFVVADPEVRLLNADVCSMSEIATESIDLAYSRSVMEHIDDVGAAYSEIGRVLRPGGKYIFLTPNAWDFASIIAYLIPNKFHAYIVRITEGRAIHKVFPTYYKSNTFRKIEYISQNQKNV